MSDEGVKFSLLEKSLELLNMSLSCKNGDPSKPIVNKVPCTLSSLYKRLVSSTSTLKLSQIAEYPFLEMVYRKEKTAVEGMLTEYLFWKHSQEKPSMVDRDMTLVYLMRQTRNIDDAEFAVMNKQGFLTVLSPNHIRIKYNIEDPIRESVHCIPIYDPFGPVGIHDYTLPTGETGYKSINEYIPPAWKPRMGKVKAELPKEVELLFSQVKEGLDRKYFYHFLHTMIWGRNSAFLILQGRGGIGKTVMKEVFEALVGSSNFTNGNRGIVTSRFNKNLAETRLTVCDEFYFEEDEVNTLKELPNPTMSIEAKFQEASRKTQMFSSFILINNDATDNRFSFEDRKFCPVDLEERRLETIMTPSQITKIREMCLMKSEEAIDYIAQIATFLYVYGKREDLFPQGEFKGTKFYRIVNANLPNWAQILIRFLLNAESILGREASRYTPSIADGTIRFSTLKSVLVKAGKTGKSENVVFPKDYTRVRNLLDEYRTVSGERAFMTKDIPDAEVWESDFMVETIPTKKKEKLEIVQSMEKTVKEAKEAKEAKESALSAADIL